MRLPLLVGARPRFMTVGPKVKLEHGNWHITQERIKDSILGLSIDDNVPVPVPVEIKGGCIVQIHIITRGSEDYIHVFAELAHNGQSG